MNITMELKHVMQADMWVWDWNVMCGPDGLTLWSAEERNLGICFQDLCLRLPVLVLLAIVSAYYCGKKSSWALRNTQPSWTFKLRKFATFLMALFPFIKLWIAVYRTSNSLHMIDYLMTVVEGLTWLMHLSYIFALKHQFGSSRRGPVLMRILWTLTFVLEMISLRSYYILLHKLLDPTLSLYLSLSYGCSIAVMICQCTYAITLLPNQRDENLEELLHSQDSEHQALLSGVQRVNSYSRFREEADPLYLGVAMEGTSFCSKLLFLWVSPLMQKGMKRNLNQPDDLHDLPVHLTPRYLCTQMEVTLKDRRSEKGRVQRRGNQTTFGYGSINNRGSTEQDEIEVAYSGRGHPLMPVSLLKALHLCFGWEFYSIGILKLIADCAGFVGPLLLNKLVTFITNKDQPLQDGYSYAAGLFSVTLIAAFCNSHFSFLMAKVGLKIRGALITTIYRKTTAVSSVTMGSFSVGEIVNFMSTDTDRVVNSCPSFHAFWSIPFQISVTFYLLYTQVQLAFLAGVAFTIILIPINKYLATKIGDLSTKLMSCKDKRVQMMTEVLRGIRVLKVHVWEDHFVGKVNNLRNLELKYLRGRKYLDALCVYFWATTPVLISILTFTTYVMLGNKLTAATVFTSIALLNMLIAPLNAFPWVLNGLTEAWVSLKRMQRLLQLPNQDLARYYTPLPGNGKELTVLVREGTFSWTDGETVLENRTEVTEGASQQEYILRGINLIVEKGQFVGVMGRVGSGKSSLLSALLGELHHEVGVVSLADQDTGFGFVTQQPWLQRGTLRENILFGKTFEDSKYSAVLEACSLEEDIRALPGGDQASVGEGGVTLSGGQKARVALARAVYQDKNIYLMDDVLSAVDVNVAHNIFKKCINGLLHKKTRILCTHHVKYLMMADKIVVLENGEISRQGIPSEVLPDYDEYLTSSEFETSETVRESNDGGDAKSMEQESDPGGTGALVEEEKEEREVGTVQWSVYTSYWRSIGHLLSIAILLSMVLMQSSRNLTDWWLSYWVSHVNASEMNSTNASFDIMYGNSTPSNSTDDDDMHYYLTVYGVLVGSNTVFTLFRAFLFAYGGVHAATKIHKVLLKTIMKAQVTFFDISPLGRILNRFSSDTYTIDDSLPFILNILLAQFFSVLGAVVVTVYGLPWLILVMAPLIPMYNWLQNHYRLTSRELKRLSSITLSPVYSHFNETLVGLPTIRAFRAVPRFMRENEDHLEANQKCQFASQAASQWLGLRLQFIGVTMVTGVGVIAVLQHQFDVADPGLVGLAISYSLSLTGMLSGLVNAFTETEKEMIAVERAYQYIDQIESERSQEILPPPYAWPSQGVVTFNHVVLKYRDYLAPSLKGVTFETRPAEKIGVMGRTGAGKSSLLMALFRLAEVNSGEILIDTVNIAHIGLRGLRSRLAIIPQDPFLFSGTIRENLDPASEYRDAELNGALQRCDLMATVRKLGGLDAQLTSGGSNLSVGQRQLLCLVRAVLHNAKILCIDEATANVDVETDRNIQHTLRTSFRQSTVISIAHRASTVMDLDRVLVMGDGQVLEFDSPDVLMRNTESQFYKFASPEYEMT